MKIGGTEISLDFKRPQKEGQFLYVGPTFGVELITVVFIPETFNGGISFPAYYGVLEYNRRNVLNLKGGFAEIES